MKGPLQSLDCNAVAVQSFDFRARKLFQVSPDGKSWIDVHSVERGRPKEKIVDSTEAPVNGGAAEFGNQDENEVLKDKIIYHDDLIQYKTHTRPVL